MDVVFSEILGKQALPSRAAPAFPSLRLAARPLPAHARRIRRLRVRRQGRRRQRPEQGLGVLRRRPQSDERDGRVPHRNLNRRGRRAGRRPEQIASTLSKGLNKCRPFDN